ncbi:thioesterase domain-containing protein [Simiduia litorea]|uniref:thioesterase domain-containing protein n=1 Tax=Simiduia litorea TaxID=1435348 RepID=UPI0036F24B51
MTRAAEISENLNVFFDEHLPLTGFMGLRVESYDGKKLVLHAPLAPNINDKSTAFGGSLYNAAVMACWGMLYLKTLEAGLVCNQVVAEGHIKYLAPVKGDIRATCSAPSEPELNAFIDRFKSHGKASLSLSAVIECGGKKAVAFEGRYAILAVT